MEKIRLIKKNIIIFLLMCLPIMNIIEVKKLIEGTLIDYSILYTPIYIKIIKDIGIIFLLFIGFVEFLSGRIKIRIMFILFSILFFIPLFISFFYFDKIITIYSLRAILPIFLYPTLKNIVDDQFQKRVSKVLLYLFILNFIIQIYECFKPISLFGIVRGYSLRNPGFFIIPSSSAAFSIICLYYFMNYLNISNFKKKILILFCVISVLLTASGTGVIILSSLWMSKIIKLEKQIFLKLILLLMFLVGVFLLLPKLMNRPDIFISPLTRIDMVKELDISFFSIRSGLASNSAVLSKVSGAWISDSQYTTILANLGLIPLIAYLMFIVDFKLVNQRKYLDFFMIYFLLGLTLIYLELFPLNFIFLINLVYFYNSESRNAVLYD